MAKQIVYGEHSRQAILRGVNSLAIAVKFSNGYIERRGGQFPQYGLANLSGNISKQRARLAQLKGAQS